MYECKYKMKQEVAVWKGDAEQVLLNEMYNSEFMVQIWIVVSSY